MLRVPENQEIAVRIRGVLLPPKKILRIFREIITKRKKNIAISKKAKDPVTKEQPTTTSPVHPPSPDGNSSEDSLENHEEEEESKEENEKPKTNNTKKNRKVKELKS